jgi:uncharacterized protein (TIGR02271 family)
MTISANQISDIMGSTVTGSDGKIGDVGQVFLDDQTDAPEWVTVRTGLFGTKESFVPIAEATLADGGLKVPYSKDTVKDAPRVDVEQGHLSLDEEGQLYRHYGLDGGGDTSAVAQSRTGDADQKVYDQESVGQEAGVVGHDTSGPTTDEAMTRSEERLRVGTQKVETGRARLRKYIVTEQKTITVPVQREEVRLEREPITEENRGQAMSGGDITEEEHEVILMEERPVVQKEVVPVERVKLAKETVADQVEVSEEVRKEQIDTDVIDDNQGTKKR